MLDVTVFRGSEATQVDDPGRISDYVRMPDELVWVDVVDWTPADLETIRDEFDLHDLALEDVQHLGQRPKLERFADHAFIVGYAHDVDVTDLPEVELFVGPNWLVSIRSRNRGGRAFDTAPVRDLYLRTCGDDAGVGFLLYRILDHMVDGYFDTVDAAEDALEGIEQALFDDAPGGRARERELVRQAHDRDLQGELLDLRRSLIVLRRRVVPMRDVVLALLRREVEWIDGAANVYLQDVLDHLLRIIDQIDTLRELLGNVVDAHFALVANRTNDVMKKTSSWGAILIVATLVAGIYGMNFRNMPELGWRFGYPTALGTMAVMTIGLYVYFKRKGWL